jgi:ABC-type transport system involved in cytochrome bd biosynthesis fused ATPase/permease subunit
MCVRAHGIGVSGTSPEGVSQTTLLLAGGVLVVVAVALGAAAVIGGATGAAVAGGALVVLFAAVGVALFLLARRVGSQADDPEEVERRLAEGMGLSEEEYEARRTSREPEAPSQSELDERFYGSEEE